MSILFVSTSRKPSEEGRLLAKWFGKVLGAFVENRGKRSVEEVQWRARAQGRSRVLFVYEDGGRPSELALLDEKQGWLSPALRIRVESLPACDERPYRKPVVARGSEANLFSELFGLEEAGHEHSDYIEWRVDKGRASFWHSQLGVGPVFTYAVEEKAVHQNGVEESG